MYSDIYLTNFIHTSFKTALTWTLPDSLFKCLLFFLACCNHNSLMNNFNLQHQNCNRKLKKVLNSMTLSTKTGFGILSFSQKWSLVSVENIWYHLLHLYPIAFNVLHIHFPAKVVWGPRLNRHQIKQCVFHNHGPGLPWFYIHTSVCQGLQWHRFTMFFQIHWQGRFIWFGTVLQMLNPSCLMISVCVLLTSSCQKTTTFVL